MVDREWRPGPFDMNLHEAMPQVPFYFQNLQPIQAPIQEFSSGGGVQPFEKFWQAKNKKKDKKGKGGLQYLYCFGMVEIYNEQKRKVY